MGERSVSVELSVQVGTVTLSNPVMTASGTSGHGAELAAYGDLSELGAVVVKSLAAEPWPGNRAPRLHPLRDGIGMINSVGLQGPGVQAWLESELPALLSRGATVVASIWGTTVESYARAATALAQAPPGVVAVEVNVSCPNIEDRRRMFAHSPSATAEVMDATSSCGRPRWAKLSPNVTDITEIAAAAVAGGAEALTLVNTLMGMVIDPTDGSFALGAGGGGVSGPALHPVAVRSIFECRAALPDTPIIGVGGNGGGGDAAEMMAAGAQAVQVGTATFADPRAPWAVLAELRRWFEENGVRRAEDLVGRARGGSFPSL
jgi:dihydroorotate dehydrogenase (NAD+) catalytic subunit